MKHSYVYYGGGGLGLTWLLLLFILLWGYNIFWWWLIILVVLSWTPPVYYYTIDNGIIKEIEQPVSGNMVYNINSKSDKEEYKGNAGNSELGIPAILFCRSAGGRWAGGR